MSPSRAGTQPPWPGPAPIRPAAAVGQLHGDGTTGRPFEQRTCPRAGCAVRGVLWDQGERGTRIAGVDQATLMPALIEGWRTAWCEDTPFLSVLL